MRYFKGSSIVISLLLIIIIAGLGIINFSGINIPYLSLLKDGAFNLISPVINLSAGFCHSVQTYWNGITRVNKLIKENESLKQRVAKLERERDILQYFSNQNQRLRELLAFKKFIPYQTTLGAEVIGYSSTQWERKLIINRGRNDGIKVKMPVISYNGTLVGKIDYVGANSSQVFLINDPEFVVGGIVQRPESRAIGLVKGQLNKFGINLMDNIAWSDDIKEDDLILTSGLSNSYPKGLPIGKVIKIEPDNYGLSQKAEIELFINLKTLEEVLVITDF